ncbi:hypothetical protein OPT61_g5666 [Boeremia exigua]|uniref:Uncharacterized protein n=1 Tax=Boeremia exigua TaxID=749465 RepID=A0ACC2I9G8_9PLEO|nr:hypothetical protein OPT61_g5666 [Boeremia exigua]
MSIKECRAAQPVGVKETVEASKLGASDNCYRVWTTGRFLGRAPLWIKVARLDVGNVFKLGGGTTALSRCVCLECWHSRAHCIKPTNAFGLDRAGFKTENVRGRFVQQVCEAKGLTMFGEPGNKSTPGLYEQRALTQNALLQVAERTVHRLAALVPWEQLDNKSIPASGMIQLSYVGEPNGHRSRGLKEEQRDAQSRCATQFCKPAKDQAIVDVRLTDTVNTERWSEVLGLAENSWRSPRWSRIMLRESNTEGHGDNDQAVKRVNLHPPRPAVQSRKNEFRELEVAGAGERLQVMVERLTRWDDT